MWFHWSLFFFVQLAMNVVDGLQRIFSPWISFLHIFLEVYIFEVVILKTKCCLLNILFLILNIFLFPSICFLFVSWEFLLYSFQIKALILNLLIFIAIVFIPYSFIFDYWSFYPIAKYITFLLLIKIHDLFDRFFYFSTVI